MGVRSARRPAVAALVANRTRTAAEVPSGRANTAWHRPILAGQDSSSRTAGQQNGTAPSLSLSSTDMIAQKSEEGCRARMLGGEDADAEAGADAEADADADADADAGARAGGAGADADG